MNKNLKPAKKLSLGFLLIGVARAGTENVVVKAATERGIVVVHVMGRNAQAVSDFAIGLILTELRNMARAHLSIKNEEWRKVFSNSDDIPELKGKSIGLIGFGYIGRLVARKLYGFEVNVLVYDPFVSPESGIRFYIRPCAVDGR